MDGPDVPRGGVPPGRHVTPGYRVSVFVYELDGRAAGAAATMVAEGEVTETAERVARGLAL